MLYVLLGLSCLLVIISFLERKRIKLHLMVTEYWMRSRDTSHLDPRRLQNRLRAMDLLHRYWRGEAFPVNTTHRERIPKIMDQRGTMCAVAYVMYHSGQQGLVSRLAQGSNHVWIGSIPNSHVLVDQLGRSGISKKEAAKIQPSYAPIPPCNAIMGPIHTADPIVEFLGVVLSIAGLAVALSFYRGLDHLSHYDKRTIISVIVLGIVAAGGGLGMLYQYSFAELFIEPFTESDFPGAYGSINVVDDVYIHYWIDGGRIDNVYSFTNRHSIQVIPYQDGRAVVAYPPVIVGHRDYYHEFVMVTYDRRDTPDVQYDLRGYTIVEFPFREEDPWFYITTVHDNMCSGFVFDHAR